MFAFQALSSDTEKNGSPKNKSDKSRTQNELKYNLSDSPEQKETEVFSNVLDNSQDISSELDEINNLLKPVKESSFAKEAEEVRIMKLYRHALSKSSESTDSEFPAKPLLESIVNSFLLRSLPLPPNLVQIKFASCKLLANVYLKSGQLDGAIKLLIQAVHLDSTDLSIWLKLANAAITLCLPELATSTLLHVLDEQPSHSLALYLALPFFLAISEFELCLELCVRTLLLDSLNETAIYCIQRIMTIQPSLEYLIEKILISRPNLLSASLTEESRSHTESRVKKIREAYVAQLEEIQDSRKVKTMFFPSPLKNITWENLTMDIVKMFDKLNSEEAICSVLDLGSLFDGGTFPSSTSTAYDIQTGSPTISSVEKILDKESEDEAINVDETLISMKSVNVSKPSDQEISEEATATRPASVPRRFDVEETEKSPEQSSCPASLSMEIDSMNTTISTTELTSKEATEKTITNEEEEIYEGWCGRARSRRSRRALHLTADDNSSTFICEVGAGTGNPTTTDGTGKAAGGSKSTDVNEQRQRWIDIAVKFRSLLPTFVRDIASLYKPLNTISSEVEAMLTQEEETTLLTEGDTPNQVVPNLSSESQQVIEFLRITLEEKPNVVTLGICLLLQLASNTTQTKTSWTHSFATAYLELSARIRPSLPDWSGAGFNTVKEDEVGVCESLLPASVILLRSAPPTLLLAQLHLSYIETRLDALATAQCHRQSPSSTNSTGDPKLAALLKALTTDSERFSDPHETIASRDLTAALQAIDRLTYVVTPKVLNSFRGRALWISYELSAIKHDYDGMDAYLGQAKDFVSVHGAIRRVCSQRNSLIDLRRIEELVYELEDISKGEKIKSMCLNQDYETLLTFLEDFLRTRSASTSKAGMSHFGVHCDGLPRICAMLAPPLTIISERIKHLDDEDDEDDNDETAGITVQRQQLILLSIRAYLLSSSILEFLLNSSVEFDHLSAFYVLPEDEVTSVNGCWSIASLAFDLHCRCWNVISNEMVISQQFQNDMKKGASTNTILESISKQNLFVAEKKSVCDPVLPEHATEIIPLSKIATDDVGLTVGHVCRTLHLIIDSLAWCLQATGVLGLNPPPVTLTLVSILYDCLDQLESHLPFCLFPSKLLVYRLLHDLNSSADKPDDDLMSSIKLQRSQHHLLSTARGHAPPPPSLQLLHLAHELLTTAAHHPHSNTIVPRSLTHNPGGCAASIGVRLLRQLIVCVIDKLSDLSRGYQSYTKCGVAVDPYESSLSNNSLAETHEGEDEEERGGNSDVTTTRHSGTTDKCTRAFSVGSDVATSWPDGCTQLGDVLAQAMHCICGLPMIPNTDSGARLNDSVTSPSKSYRFKAKSRTTPIEEDERTSCLLPLPLWLSDASLFYENVEDHDTLGDSTTSGGEEGTDKASGVWWDKSAPSKFDWNVIEIAFVFYQPCLLPEYDSLKTLSISNELATWLTEAIPLIPKEVTGMFLSETRITSCMTERAEIPIQEHQFSDLVNLMFYLLADYHTKSNNFDLAINDYMQDLRVAPYHADSWAALALIHSSQLEQILNMTDPKTERISARSVTTCLRCFEIALDLQPRFVTLLTERGCLAYQIHSYAARIIKKSKFRTFQETHLTQCRYWHLTMLNLAFESYSLAMSSDGVSEKPIVKDASTEGEQADNEAQNDEESLLAEEEWLYHYMLTKCAEKAGPSGLLLSHQPSSNDRETNSEWVLRIINSYKKTANVLQAAGAKYPRKIVVYNKLPYLAVEAIEVFYRTHVFVLKRLLKCGEPSLDKPCPLPLHEISEALFNLSQSHFVVEPGKAALKNRNRKRASNMMSSGSKQDEVNPPSAKQGKTEETATTIPEVSTPTNPSEVEGGSSSTPLPIPVVESQPPVLLEQTATPLPETAVDKPFITALSEAGMWRVCVDRCREAMELVLRRLPLHYKSMYRLAHLYITIPAMMDLDKAMGILMGPFDHFTKVDLGGLFKDRRQINFFHGVWRIPTADIDRSGNFAAHMYRSTFMVLDVLNKRGDWRRLLQVFHQLRKQPPDDKRGFLSEGDRVYLARRAFNLVHPALRLWLSELTTPTSSITTDILNQIYRLYCFAQSRHEQASQVQHNQFDGNKSPQSHNSTAAGFADLLAVAYRLCPLAWDESGSNVTVEDVIKRCNTDMMIKSPTKQSTIARSNLLVSAAQQTTSLSKPAPLSNEASQNK